MIPVVDDSSPHDGTRGFGTASGPNGHGTTPKRSQPCCTRHTVRRVQRLISRQAVPERQGPETRIESPVDRFPKGRTAEGSDSGSLSSDRGTARPEPPSPIRPRSAATPRGAKQSDEQAASQDARLQCRLYQRAELDTSRQAATRPGVRVSDHAVSKSRGHCTSGPVVRRHDRSLNREGRAPRERSRRLVGDRFRLSGCQTQTWARQLAPRPPDGRGRVQEQVASSRRVPPRLAR